jgi:hypothetical protein
MCIYVYMCIVYILYVCICVAWAQTADVASRYTHRAKQGPGSQVPPFEGKVPRFLTNACFREGSVRRTNAPRICTVDESSRPPHTNRILYICISIHTYIYTYIHTYIHTYKHLYTHTVPLSECNISPPSAHTEYIYYYIPTYTHKLIHTNRILYKTIYIPLSVFRISPLSAHMHIHKYIHTHTYTHTHTYINIPVSVCRISPLSARSLGSPQCCWAAPA